MSAVPATELEPTERYEALIRAANALASCGDCDHAAEVLVRELHRIIPFDYLQFVVFDPGTNAVGWHFLYAKGKRQPIAFPDAASPATAIGWVYEHQQPLVTPDWLLSHNHNKEKQFPRHASLLNQLGIASTCTLPLSRGNRRLAVLEVGSGLRNAYSNDDLRFLRLAADQLALAIDAAANLRLSEQAEGRLKIILDLTNQVVSNLNFQELLRVISGSVRQVMHCDAAAIMLPEPDGEHLRVHALDFPNSRGFFREQVTIPIQNTMPGQTFRSGQPTVKNQLDPAEDPPEMYAKAVAEGVNSFCDVALSSRDRILGVLVVARHEANTFDAGEVAFFSQLANQVAIALENALAYGEIAELKDKLAQEKLYLENEIRGELDFEGIVGQSSALRHVLNLVETVAPSDSTVLLLGETGTGKELIARAIHDRSRRKDRTLVKLNCAAIPTGLLESELFGHERGAFTGAISQKIGRLELSDRGTLFLDEVGDIPIDIQPKLLRALQEREFERLGSTITKRVDVRLVAATNRNLEKMVEEREFRSDLYYRLNIFPIRIPPLRERPEDIPLLVRYFTQKYARRMEKPIESIPAAALKKLSSWSWPGNIRELENLIERSVILTHGTILEVPVSELNHNGHATPAMATRETAERDEILRVLQETKGRVAGPQGAAARMGLKRTTLISRMKKLGIDPRRAV